MLFIKIEGRTNIDSALKTLKNKFSKTKVLNELRERKTFVKKSERRREEILKAKRIQSLRNNEGFE